ncbi:MAG: ATP-dependent DNA helicase RecQ [Rikenellaceae bacterium]
MKRKEQKEKLSINELLKKYWGYDDFRPMQREIIDSVLSGHDTLALLPTGGGKSLTYQIPALMSDGICIVITPLIALMKDQIDKLRSLAIPAVSIHSGMSPRQIEIAFDNCVYGDIKFLYVSPERVATEMFRYRVQRMNVSLVAVDEAHCISQWGYDFRPSYLKIAEFREHTGYAPMIALTASATKVVVEDIEEKLKFKESKIFRGSFARPNLVYVIRRTEDKDNQLFRILESVKGSGVVYVRTRDAAEQLSQTLCAQGIESTYYHGGLPHTERALRQEEWLSGEVRIIVATNAFGMGIDKPDVRIVVHYTMCDSLENYYQEAGRAGRDGQRSYAVLLVAPDDNAKIVKRFMAEFPPIDQIKEIYDKICSSLQIAIDDGDMSSHIFNPYDFCSKERLFKGTLMSALKILEANDCMTFVDEMANPARIMFCVNRDDLYKVRVDHNDLDHFLRVILRLYEGLFSDFRQINELEIAHWSGYKLDKVQDLLKRLWQMRLIRYVPANQSPMIYLNCERLAPGSIYISPDTYKNRREMAEQRFANMLAYCENETTCRSRFFEDYFNVDSSGDCGVCDICLDRKRREKSVKLDVKEKILELLAKEGLLISEIAKLINCTPQSVTKAIEELITEDKIIQLTSSKIELKPRSALKN